MKISGSHSLMQLIAEALKPERCSQVKKTTCCVAAKPLTHLGNEKVRLLFQLLPSCAHSRPLGGVSSEPLLSLSLDGARVASESPVTVKIESERLGRSSCASGAKLSWTICRALWQTGAWMVGVSVGRSKVRTVWVLEVSSSSLSRLLYDVPFARWDSMMLSKWRLNVSSAPQRGPETKIGDFRAGWWLSKKVSIGLEREAETR